ncbi:MAG: tRNA-(ms[2]io[6]A)-hydroxylase [Bacteroidetes bacterium]|nr:MAG: tRNA-(ms[2]io[6]A)-hydroxylase [Bacteroidota bacterium]
MQYRLEVSYPSPKEWIETVIENFDEFLQDHADCERKASAMAMSFIAKAPERVEIIPQLIDTAVEELEHFRDVYAIMQKRNIPLKKEIPPDEYMNKLLSHCRSGRNDRFLDRMLIASIVETRGAERFRLVAENIKDVELQQFYKKLWTSEAKHGNIFVEMALNYWTENEIYSRLNELNQIEGNIIKQLPIRPALH